MESARISDRKATVVRGSGGAGERGSGGSAVRQRSLATLRLRSGQASLTDPGASGAGEINYQLSIINYQLSIINYQLSIINYTPTNNHQLITNNFCRVES
jgi:hypothetical protein